jgi:hypothetical protein
MKQPFPIAIVAISLFTLSATAQKSAPVTPGKLEVEAHQLVLDAPADSQAQKPDPQKLRQEANELSNLAQSLPADVSQAVQGKLPKDMAEKLKRIEKLSKHLRSELTQ